MQGGNFPSRWCAPGASQEERSGSTPTCTDTAPPFRPPLERGKFPRRRLLPPLSAGERLADFVILRKLGSGGLADVYLARQVSLDRLVALKLSCRRDNEARTLARLEHHSVVQVYAELNHAEMDLGLICMQFVPGPNLAHVIRELARHERRCWHGRIFLAALETLGPDEARFDLAGFQTRALLQSCDHAEVACWFGARLAEALAHAHREGIVHRDIKPANILINRYGWPFLTDFNIARNAQAENPGHFGGTPLYMAPEHLDAFRRDTDHVATAVDARSDLYSLGMVLFEFLTGHLPFEPATTSHDRQDLLAELAALRHTADRSPRRICPAVPEVLDRIVQRCLEPTPRRRFASAEALMQSLEGCRHLLGIDNEADRPGWLTCFCRTRPFVMLLTLALVPNLIGSVFNIAYNFGHIVHDLDALQRQCFVRLVLIYNAVAYPVLAAIGVAVLLQVHHGRRRLREDPCFAPEEAARVRRQALALPRWAICLISLGWFPGALIFPAVLHFWAGPVPVGDLVHLTISFSLSGLIAMTYASFGVTFVVLRVLYPQLWSDPAATQQRAKKELRTLPGRLCFFQFLAGLIPLSGAALLIGIGPQELSWSFRLLLTALIILGIVGFGVATHVANRLERIADWLTGTSRPTKDQV